MRAQSPDRRMEYDYDSVFNVNVGLIGHVDSGKTTLAKTLSTVASTAAFDKNPQSQQRGITIDLGFSSFLMELNEKLRGNPQLKSKSIVQFTLVDCPGHASLLKTIISGSKIMHFAMCIIDITHGIQTQTAECIMLAELLKIKLIFVLTKLDLLSDNDGKNIDEIVNKMKMRVRKTLEKTVFHDSPIVGVDITQKHSRYNTEKLKNSLLDCVQPRHNILMPESKFLFAVDHCFNIKGHGTVVTGTVIDGSVGVKSSVLVASTNDIRKVKSIQVFRKNVEKINQGDRAGICITQFDSAAMERGLLCAPGSISTVQCFICVLNHFKYYKQPVQNKCKFHVSICFDTIVGNVHLFKDTEQNASVENFNMDSSFVNIEKIESGSCYALITLQTPTFYCNIDTIIGLKLDQDISKKSCRIAFEGKIVKTFEKDESKTIPIKIYRIKTKMGVVDKLLKENYLIVKEMFKKESKIDTFIGFPVTFSDGCVGIIEGKFGTAGKIKIQLDNSKANCLHKDEYHKSNAPISLKYKQLTNDKTKIYKLIS